jgi:hypothetical protein
MYPSERIAVEALGQAWAAGENPADDRPVVDEDT